MKRGKLLLFTVSFALACKGGGDSTGTAAECGDIDGSGDIPDVLGLWTTNFAVTWFDDSCDSVEQEDLAWLTGPIEISGYVPNGLDMLLDDDRQLRGAISTTGGMAFAGVTDHAIGTLQVAAGGLAFHDPWLDRDIWNGSVFVNIDVDDDGKPDCDARGDWSARKSGN